MNRSNEYKRIMSFANEMKNKHPLNAVAEVMSINRHTRSVEKHFGCKQIRHIVQKNENNFVNAMINSNTQLYPRRKQKTNLIHSKFFNNEICVYSLGFVQITRLSERRMC